MLDDEVKDIDSIIDQGLNAENNELDLREKELDDEDLIKVMQSDKIKGVTAVFLEFNEIGDKGLEALLECEHMKCVTALPCLFCDLNGVILVLRGENLILSFTRAITYIK